MFESVSSGIGGFGASEESAMKQKRENKGPSKLKLYKRSLAILERIRKNEAEGRVHPKDEADKVRCQKVVDEYLELQATSITEVRKRNLSHDESGNMTKRYKISDQGAGASKPIKQLSEMGRDRFRMALVGGTSTRGKPVLDKWSDFEARDCGNVTKKHKILDQGAVASKPIKRFSEMVRDRFQMALVDSTSNRGKPVLDKWSEIEARLSRIVVDHVMANPEGQSPSFDSVEVVRCYRVIKCDDQFSLNFLINTIDKIQNCWEGLKLKLIPASEIPRRPRARIWIPNMGFEANQLIPYLQAHNRSVPITDWSIIKAEAPQKHSVSFLLQITEESIEPLEKVGNKLRFGIRKAQLKIFRSANPEEEQDEVNGANELRTGMQLDDAEPKKANY